MNAHDAVDMGREAITTGLWVSAPILVVGLIIGLIVGILQAMTQVQDQTVAFTPKIIVMIVMLSLCLPWLASQMLDYSQKQFSEVPSQINTADVDWSADTQWR